MRNKTTEIYSNIKPLFIVHPERPWPQYFKELAERLGLVFCQVTAHCWTLILFHGLTTPFGVFIYLFCLTYKSFSTQTASLFASQLWAGYYISLLLWCSVLLPVLMLNSSVRGFLYSLIGEQLVLERVGRWGVRPLIAAFTGPFLLAYLDITTRSLVAVPDLQHLDEVNAHTLQAYRENRESYWKQVNQINQDVSITSPEERQEKKRALLEEHYERQDKITAHYGQVIDLIDPSKESKNGVVTQLSDRIKDFFRGKEKNRSFLILDRALAGGLGLDQYDQAREVEDLRASLKKEDN